jgi:hypothetical protein
MGEPDPELERLEPHDIDVDEIVVEERAAARRLSSIEAGRRKGGAVGAGLAGAMLAVSEIYQGPVREDEIVAVSEHPGEPGDIDEDGIDVTVGEVDVWAPPPHPRGDHPRGDQAPDA